MITLWCYGQSEYYLWCCRIFFVDIHIHITYLTVWYVKIAWRHLSKTGSYRHKKIKLFFPCSSSIYCTNFLLYLFAKKKNFFNFLAKKDEVGEKLFFLFEMERSELSNRCERVFGNVITVFLNARAFWRVVKSFYESKNWLVYNHLTQR